MTIPKMRFAALVCAAMVAGQAMAADPVKEGGEPIKVGAILALSGMSSIYGGPAEKALRLIVAKLPNGELEGHPLKLIVTDSEGNSTKAAQLFRKLAELDEVDIVFGPTLSGESISIAPIANQLKLTMVSFAGAEPITKPVTPYVFSMGPTDRIVVHNLMTALRDRNIKRISLIHSVDAFGQSGGSIVKELASQYGVEVVSVETFNPQDTNMSPQLLRIKEGKPEALVIWALHPGPTIVLRNAKEIGMPMQLFSSYSSASTTFAQQTGPAGDGLLVPSYPILAPEVLPDSEGRKAMMLQFNRDYQALWGIAPDQTASHAIDAIMSLRQVLKEMKGPLTREKLRDGFEQVKICGAIGCRRMSPQDHRGLDQSALVLMQVRDGKWHAAPAATKLQDGK